MNGRFLRLREVKYRTGLGRSSIYSGMKAGTFPSQIRLGERAVGWDEAEISEWMESRIATARNGGNHA